MAYTLAAGAIVGSYFAVVAAIAELVHTRVPSAGPFGHGRRRRHRVAVRSGPQVDSGKARRLSSIARATTIAVRWWSLDASSVRRPISTKCSRRWSTGGAHATGRPPGHLSRQQRLFALRTFEIVRAGPDQRCGPAFLQSRESKMRPGTSSSKTRASCRVKPASAGSHLPPRFELLHSVPRAAKDHRVPRTGQNDGRRLPLQRRRGVARNARRIHWHRNPERAPLRLTRTKGQRVSSASRTFNENIVESINVGVLAVDLQDRIESWNSQMEVMYAKPRWQVVGRSLSEVFPGRASSSCSPVSGRTRHPQPYKFRLGTPPGVARRQRRDRAAGHAQVQCGRAAG